MIPQFITYLPQDRLNALAYGESLPDHTSGSALFADISGFTPLTEAFKKSLGSRRGAEELSHQINTVYSALIADIEKYGGSVISFAGDSFLCWFDEVQGPASARAVTCAFELQNVMRQFEAIRLVYDSREKLTLKVTVATGLARRFVVGDPNVHYLDALAGATVTRTATAEHLANKREILIDETTAQVLEPYLTIKEWRTDRESHERFAVVTQIADLVTKAIQTKRIAKIDPAILQAWLLPAVYEREQAGQDTFLTEFRPAVAMFVRFIGIDYDNDEAQIQLDAFIRQTQAIIDQYEGALIQLTVGDKGSYISINFGALSAHEDDARRAIKTARELRMMAASLGFLAPVQIGIAQGIMRVGAYGGSTRRTYGTLGDDVNLAARLMQTASPGEILLNGSVHKATINDFVFEPRPPLRIKGKAEPLPIFAVTGKRKQRAIRLQEPRYALPMVGRQRELKAIEAILDLAAEGKGQVIGIVAEAGLGKSRLVAEVIRSARRKNFVGYGGACQSDGIHTPYLAWKTIWGAFFDIDPEMPQKKLIRWLEGEIGDRARSRMDAMPLLNVVLDLNIPENDFTLNLEPKTRQSALHALLEDCLKAAAQEEPILIVIEDLHWIDSLSHDLLEQMAKALANHAVCFVLAYRPQKRLPFKGIRLEAFQQFTRIELGELTKTESKQAIRAKLAQLYPVRGGELPEGLVDVLMARAQGNPFYLEELLNFVRDRGLDPANIGNIKLPDSLHTLILSRIDQLNEGEKTILRVASIVGRLFRARWLTGYYPEIGELQKVKEVLDELDSLDITTLDSAEPELAYLFKHFVTYEVTYESLPFTTRAILHEQLARFLENLSSETETLLDTITFHYGRSKNVEKQRQYLRKAGETAQKNFANDAALVYYGELLPLLKDRKEQTQILLRRGQVYEFIGKYDDAENDYRAALLDAENDMESKASAQYALGKLNRLRGDYESALEWLVEAEQSHRQLDDTHGLARVMIESGMVSHRKGEYAQAREPLNAGLALARAANDKLNTALALNNLGNVAYRLGNYITARDLYEESLALRREMGDKIGIAASLNNLGNVAYSQGDYAVVRALHEESLVLKREMGDKWGIAMSLNNLGNVGVDQGEYNAAWTSYEESLELFRDIGDKWGIAMLLNNLGTVALAQCEYSVAWASYEESLMLCKEMDEKTLAAYALLGMGLVALAEDKPEAGDNILQSLQIRLELGEQLPQASSLIGVAGLVLQDGNAQFAAQLLGAVESAVKRLNAMVEVDVKFFHKQTLAKVKDVLGETAFQSAWEDGKKLSLDEAVSLALDGAK